MELGLDEAFAGDIAAYVRQGGDEKETYELCSAYAMKKGNYDKAIEIYEKQLDDRALGEVPCYAEMAICLCKQGKSGEAEAVLQAAIDSGGNNPEWLYTLYEIQRSRGNFKGASRTLKRIRKNAGVTVFNDDYGELSVRLFLEEGRLAIAGKMAESLSSYDGEKLCAILYVLRGNYRSAMRLLRKLSTGSRKNWNTTAGWCCVRLFGENEAARPTTRNRDLRPLQKNTFPWKN